MITFICAYLYAYVGVKSLSASSLRVAHEQPTSANLDRSGKPWRDSIPSAFTTRNTCDRSILGCAVGACVRGWPFAIVVPPWDEPLWGSAAGSWHGSCARRLETALTRYAADQLFGLNVALQPPSAQMEKTRDRITTLAQTLVGPHHLAFETHFWPVESQVRRSHLQFHDIAHAQHGTGFNIYPAYA